MFGKKGNALKREAKRECEARKANFHLQRQIGKRLLKQLRRKNSYG